MTVKELIEKLKEFDENLEVVIDNAYTEFTWSTYDTTHESHELKPEDIHKTIYYHLIPEPWKFRNELKHEYKDCVYIWTYE
jgi:hypothetical protein